ncbi:MAG: aminotransferase class I/II-fold pyridoxal phosphate-dependent enzyme [Lachnospiraceae bacterium]|nr:aminotransferase class I/II-fold pyridoxal phosphate-dependent enzyme [Lachnospiraceae bacterium]
MEEYKNSILGKLKSYSESDYYPFHMPGHKRRDIADFYSDEKKQGSGFPNPYGIDITEIDGFDNLHHAEGILKESMEDVAEIYGSDHSYYLVNGSTCGILSAICGCTKSGGRILMARNCHKAAYHGAILHQLEVEYLYPEYLEKYGINGGILAEDVRAALEKDRTAENGDEESEKCGKVNGKIQAVLIVSPTYEGIVSDVQAIADVAHEYGIPLIVDEAHGAHLPFAYREESWKSKFPKSALECGADVVIQSLHKTLPSFTQTAIMHIKGDFVRRVKIERYLGMFQSSSPSYLFMAAMERCVQFMNGDGREEMMRYEQRMEQFFESLKEMKVLKVLGREVCEEESVFDWDLSKVVVSTSQAVKFAKKTSDDEESEDVARFGGEALCEILRNKYHLEMEMAAPEYVIAMTSLMDTEEGLKRLSDALLEIDEELCEEILQTVFLDQLGSDRKKKMEKDSLLAKLPKAVPVITLAEAMDRKGQRITFSDSLNMISQEFVYLYPPGIPILAPGEKITKDILERIAWYKSMRLSVQGVLDPSLYSIITVAEE